MENQHQNLSNIQYPRTPGDVLAEFNVANGDPEASLGLGNLMVVDQMSTGDSELSLDVKPKFVRKLDDEYAEKLVEWSEKNNLLKTEARMRIEVQHGLKRGDPGEPEAYARELKFLQDNFGTPKPIKSIESPSIN